MGGGDLDPDGLNDLSEEAQTVAEILGQCRSWFVYGAKEDGAAMTTLYVPGGDSEESMQESANVTASAALEAHRLYISFRRELEGPDGES